MFQRFFGQSSIPDVTPEETQRKQHAGAVLVDVREADEWRQGHIPGALYIPLGNLARRLQELDPARETILVCRSGSRSLMAARLLQRAGFTQVSNMAGGMTRWMHQHLPVSQR